ncbi:MAG: flavoprotein [Micromonosporaceae bacterium]
MGAVLYILVSGCPAARDVGRLVDLAQQAGWQTCVIASPDGVKFIDSDALEKQTGHPVRSQYKQPADPDILPPPSALIAAPATTNTINKWAAGISDTLLLGLLVEGLGKGLPIVTMPFTNTAQAAHPAFGENLERLRRWGVTVLYGDDVYPLHPPGTGDDRMSQFPWGDALRALERNSGALPDAPRAWERKAGA